MILVALFFATWLLLFAVGMTIVFGLIYFMGRFLRWLMDWSMPLPRQDSERGSTWPT